MWVTDSMHSPGNGLDGLAAAGSVLLAAFLALGGVGHLAAVGSAPAGEASLLLPGLVLLVGAVINLLACPGLWRARRAWQWAILLVNLLLAADLVRLSIAGVPDHPIGVFLALVGSQLIVLGAVLAGLEWCAPDE